MPRSWIDETDAKRQQAPDQNLTTPTKPFLSHEIRAAIEAYYPRYPSRRAVVLPALHVVNERLGYVPLEAVIEIARMLGLAPAQVQDTLSFYHFFPQDKPLRQVQGVDVPFDQLLVLRGRDADGLPGPKAGHSARRDHRRRSRDACCRPNVWGPATSPPRCW